MKFIKHFESNEDNIQEICSGFDIKNYYIHDGLINVNGNVNLGYRRLSILPLKFGEVSGSFLCYNNNLTSLKGAPNYVCGDFWCGDNNLTTLEGAPNYVGGRFFCNSNNLTTLEGAPKEIGGDFYCHGNNLTTLMFAPEKIGGNFYCYPNPLPPEIYRLTQEQLNWVVNKPIIICGVVVSYSYQGSKC